MFYFFITSICNVCERIVLGSERLYNSKNFLFFCYFCLVISDMGTDEAGKFIGHSFYYFKFRQCY